MAACTANLWGAGSDPALRDHGLFLSSTSGKQTQPVTLDWEGGSFEFDEKLWHEVQHLVKEGNFREAWRAFDRVRTKNRHKLSTHERIALIEYIADEQKVSDQLPDAYQNRLYRDWFIVWKDNHPKYKDPVHSLLARQFKPTLPPLPRDSGGQALIPTRNLPKNPRLLLENPDQYLSEYAQSKDPRVRAYVEQVKDAHRIHNYLAAIKSSRIFSRTPTLKAGNALEPDVFASTNGTSVFLSDDYVSRRRAARSGNRDAADELVRSNAHELRHQADDILIGLELDDKIPDLSPEITYNQLLFPRDKQVPRRTVEYYTEISRIVHQKSGATNRNQAESPRTSVKLAKFWWQFRAIWSVFSEPLSAPLQWYVKRARESYNYLSASPPNQRQNAQKNERIAKLLATIVYRFGSEYNADVDTGTTRDTLAESIWASVGDDVRGHVAELEKISPGLLEELALNEIRDGYSLAAWVEYVTSADNAELMNIISFARTQVQQRAGS